jgi:hypothetical protein
MEKSHQGQDFFVAFFNFNGKEVKLNLKERSLTLNVPANHKISVRYEGEFFAQRSTVAMIQSTQRFPDKRTSSAF